MDINETLLRNARKRAADGGTTLRAVLEEALRAWLAAPPAAAGWRLRWRTEKGRILPGVDLADRDSLFEATEGDDGAAGRGFR